LAAVAVTCSAVVAAAYIVKVAQVEPVYRSAAASAALLFTLPLVLTVVGLVRVPRRGRVSLGAAALLLAVPGAYLLPVWQISVPMLAGSACALASAVVAGRRSRRPT
jgi:hypothetical protein